MIVAHHNFLVDLHRASFNLADADATDVFVVVDSADKQLKFAVLISLGSGDIIHNCIKEGLE